MRLKTSANAPETAICLRVLFSVLLAVTFDIANLPVACSAV
jgi:hypothetical protein